MSVIYSIHHAAHDSKTNIPDERTRPALHVLSQQQNKPEAEVIRELLETGLKKQRPVSTGEALLGLARLGEELGMSDPTDLSERHDDYLRVSALHRWPICVGVGTADGVS